MKALLNFFAVLSAVGLALSLISHLAALLGTTGPLGDKAWMLHIGCFVVWLPAVLVMNRLTKDVPRRDIWKTALRGSPPWMRNMTYAFLWYAMLNFLVFLTNAPKATGSGPMPPAVVRGFSGHWMAFYSAALAMLYSGMNLWEQTSPRRCPNGHDVGSMAKFCDQCGQPIIELEDTSERSRNK